jgi:GT2 family glycosyltransferase
MVEREGQKQSHAATIDVVIVNYNAGRMLARVVAALHAQSFRDFRVVIVDNGSSDDSLENLPDGPTRVEVVRAGRNLGFTGGNNLAIRQHVSAEWLALLNPDAFPHADWLERLLAAARANPEFSFFGSRLLDAENPAVLDGTGDVYHVCGLFWRDGHGCPDSPAYARSHEVFSVCAAAALYRTRDVVAAGGFDDDFFCYGEDVDLGFRLRLLGHRGLYVAEAIVDHVGSGVTGVRSDFSLYHGHRNLLWVYVKNMPAPLFWIYLPYHLALNLCSLVVFAIRGRGRPLWRAKRDALRGLRRNVAKRREIQKKRVASIGDLRRMLQGGWVRKRCR